MLNSERRRKLIFLLFFPILGLVATAQTQEHGHYVGTVKAEWESDGRHMKLLEDFEYVGPDGTIWIAPKDWVVDGASIPQIFWSLMGGPFEGKYRDASVIHDVACDKKERPWEAVHLAFYEGMLASGVTDVRAKVMYAAVYHFGPRWPRTVKLSPIITKGN